MGPWKLVSPGEQRGQTGIATRALCKPLQSLPSGLSNPLLSFLELEAYCLIKILRHTSSLGDDRGTCISSSRSLCASSRLWCDGHHLLLSSYLSRINKSKNPLCSTCGHPSQVTSHRILPCPATDSLCRSLFGEFLCLYNL